MEHYRAVPVGGALAEKRKADLSHSRTLIRTLLSTPAREAGKRKRGEGEKVATKRPRSIQEYGIGNKCQPVVACAGRGIYPRSRVSYTLSDHEKIADSQGLQKFLFRTP